MVFGPGFESPPLPASPALAAAASGSLGNFGAGLSLGCEKAGGGKSGGSLPPARLLGSQPLGTAASFSPAFGGGEEQQGGVNPVPGHGGREVRNKKKTATQEEEGDTESA